MSREMVERFQCPGCVNGCDTECGRYKPKSDGGSFRCEGHVLGTSMLGVGHLALGLPKGFCRSAKGKNTMDIFLWSKDSKEKPVLDRFNIPVWALVKDGYLFVRVVCPRVEKVMTYVIEGGDLSMVPNALDVSTFFDDFD